MDSLQRLGIHPHLSKPDFLLALNSLSITVLGDLRYALFVDAVNKELVCNKKILVNRRGSAINPLPRKLAEDIWTLTDCLKHKKLVPRMILKNGKRDRETFENTQSTQPIQPTQSPMSIPNDSIESEVTNRSSNCDRQANPS